VSLLASTRPQTASVAANHSEQGFTLIEVLVVVVTAMVVFGAVLVVLVPANTQSTTSTNKVVALDKLEVQMSRMTRELRQATSDGGASVTVSTTATPAANSVSFAMYETSSTGVDYHRITYVCGANTTLSACWRYDQDCGASAAVTSTTFATCGAVAPTAPAALPPATPLATGVLKEIDNLTSFNVFKTVSATGMPASVQISLSQQITGGTTGQALPSIALMGTVTPRDSSCQLVTSAPCD
jgi:type II secretory pathway pseudopilin PulG